MEYDFLAELQTVERRITNCQHGGQPAMAVILSRGYPTTIDNLWQAITVAERLSHWFTPITGELKVGGRYQLEGNAGGLIENCEENSQLTLTWEFAGDVSRLAVDLLANDQGDMSQLILTHTGPVNEHWQRYGPGATGIGWDLALMGLAVHIARPDAPKIDHLEFVSSSVGKDCIVNSGRHWQQVAIASGEKAMEAQVAAENSISFYLPPER